MGSHQGWPTARPITTARLIMEPLRVKHAVEVAEALDDEALHAYTGGHPATADQLGDRYASQVRGRSADGRQGWLNWVARHRRAADVVGTLQATVHHESGRTVADVAWVIRSSYQRHGYASEAAAAMITWLARHGVETFSAHIHPSHDASMGVARNLGLEATGTIVDGEIRWTS